MTAKKFTKNPLVRVKVKSPSQRTGKAPSKRLVARRKVTAKAPKGVYANPVKKPARKTIPNSASGGFVVSFKTKGDFVEIARFRLFSLASEYAKAVHAQHPLWTVKVE